MRRINDSIRSRHTQRSAANTRLISPPWCKIKRRHPLWSVSTLTTFLTNAASANNHIIAQESAIWLFVRRVAIIERRKNFAATVRALVQRDASATALSLPFGLDSRPRRRDLKTSFQRRFSLYYAYATTTSIQYTLPPPFYLCAYCFDLEKAYKCYLLPSPLPLHNIPVCNEMSIFFSPRCLWCTLPFSLLWKAIGSATKTTVEQFCKWLQCACDDLAGFLVWRFKKLNFYIFNVIWTENLGFG